MTAVIRGCNIFQVLWTNRSDVEKMHCSRKESK